MWGNKGDDSNLQKRLMFSFELEVGNFQGKCLRTTFPGLRTIQSKGFPDKCPVVAEQPRRHKKELVIRTAIFFFRSPMKVLTLRFFLLKALFVHFALFLSL